jgi:hypothetical protein
VLLSTHEQLVVWNSSSIALKASDTSPHTSYLFKFLKSAQDDKGPGKDFQV